MAEENTVTMTVENVDQLFPEIVVNGEAHVSQNYVAPSPQPQEATPVTEEESNPQEPVTPAETVQGQDVYAVELNETLHNFVDRAVTQGLANEVQDRQDADTALQNSINAINDKIPAQASASNQLADKNFVNSSIATNTANFLGTYTSLADIEAIQNPTNNDYAFLETTDSAGNTLYDRYKYNAEDDEWLFEYELNNSGFTAEQWATINSGLTQQSVDQDIADALASLGVTPQAIFDTCHPVGEVYIQYPAKKDPATLYNVSGSVVTVWTEITADYDGAFFRAYKNNTSGDFVAYGESLVNKMQASQNLSHNHGGSSGYSGSLSLSGGNHRHHINNYTANFSGSSGYSVIQASGSSKYDVYSPQYTGYSGNFSMTGGNHTHTISSAGGDEARPNNFAIKIWERTQ